MGITEAEAQDFGSSDEGLGHVDPSGRDTGRKAHG